MDTNELIARAEFAKSCIPDDFGEKAVDIFSDLIAALRAEKEARERAEAMVAAAYRDAADQVAMTMRHAILARTPADASAALGRIRQQAEDEALERAAGLKDKASISGGMAKSMAHFIHADDWRKYRETCEAYSNAILALKGGV